MPHLKKFLDHTQRRPTVGETPLEECSARRRDLYLKTSTLTRDRHPMPPAEFEPTISVGDRPQTYGLDRAATGNCYDFTLLKLTIVV